MRAAMSVEPPAGYATMSCTGLVGKSCCASVLPVVAASAKVAPMAAWTMLEIMGVPPLIDCHSGFRFTHLGRWRAEQRADEDDDGGKQQPQAYGPAVEDRQIAA